MCWKGLSDIVEYMQYAQMHMAGEEMDYSGNVGVQTGEVIRKLMAFRGRKVWYSSQQGVFTIENIFIEVNGPLIYLKPFPSGTTRHDSYHWSDIKSITDTVLTFGVIWVSVHPTKFI